MQGFTKQLIFFAVFLWLISCAGKNHENPAALPPNNSSVKATDKPKKVVSLPEGINIEKYKKHGFSFTEEFAPLTETHVKGIYDFKKKIETDTFVLDHFNGISANSITDNFEHLEINAKVRVVILHLRKEHQTVILGPEGKFYAYDNSNLGMLFKPISTEEAAREFSNLLLSMNSYNRELGGAGITINNKTELDSLVANIKQSCQLSFKVDPPGTFGIQSVKIQLGIKVQTLYAADSGIHSDSLIVLSDNNFGTKSIFVAKFLEEFLQEASSDEMAIGDHYIPNAPPEFTQPNQKKSEQEEKVAQQRQRLEDKAECVERVLKNIAISQKGRIIHSPDLMKKKDDNWQFPPQSN